MFYHFEELKVTLVVPKSRKNDDNNHFVRILGTTQPKSLSD